MIEAGTIGRASEWVWVIASRDDLGDDDRRLRPDGRCASSSFDDHCLHLRSRASILRAAPVERAAAFSYRYGRSQIFVSELR
jgi:hypothetical protein